MSQHCVRRSLLIALCLALLSSQFLFADDAHKWGSITADEWAATPPADFPHAPAIVIFDIGSLKVGIREVKYEVHRRFKIFDRLAASSIINVEIPVAKVDDFGGFSAQTYLPNGKKYSYSSMKLFKKKISDALEVYSFSFPAVEDGCIVELKYGVTSQGGDDLPSWQFQNNYYTLESQFSFTPSPYFIFNTVMIGLHDTLLTPAGEDTHLDHKATKRFTWTMRDIPPLVDEPGQGAQLNFQPSMYFQFTGFKTDYLYGFRLDETFELSLLDSWSDLAHLLSRVYDRQLIIDDSLRTVVDSLLKVAPDLLHDQIKAFFEFVRDAVTTTNEGSEGIYPSQSTAETLRRRAGNAVDKNLLLIAMLQSLKHDANPLLIASRDHARFSTNILNSNQFNYMICHMKVGSTNYLLDTSTKDYPFPYLSPALRAEGGLVLTGDRLHRFTYAHDATRVSDKPVDTLHIEHSKWTSGIRTDAAIWLNEDGSAVCTTYVTLSGYEQQVLGADHGAKPTSELVSTMLRSLRDKDIENVEIQKLEPEDPDSTAFSIILTIPDFCTVGGGVLACTPALLWTGENRFTSATRQFPIDFLYPRFYSETLVLHLPPSFAMATLPGNVSNITPDLLYSRAVLHDDNSARILTNLMIKRYFFPPEEYNTVREFYQKSTASINESFTATVR